MVAVMALERTVTFAASHDHSKFAEPSIKSMRERVELVPDAALPRRHPIVILHTTDGREFQHATDAVRGTPDNPMTRAEVHAKAYDLFRPTFGDANAAELLDALWRLDELSDLRRIAQLLRA